MPSQMPEQIGASHSLHLKLGKPPVDFVTTTGSPPVRAGYEMISGVQ